MKYELVPGHAYRATLSLGFFEKFASNATISAKLTDAGFVDVIVTGSGPERVATGEWGGAAQTVDLPSQIQHVEAVS